VVYDGPMSDVLDLRNQPESDITPAHSEEEDVTSEPTLAWEAQTRLSSRAWRRHYWAVGTVGAVGAAVAFWQASWLVLATLAVCLGTWELRERLVHPTAVSIDRKGITVNGHSYPHAALRSFEVHRMPDGSHELSVHTESWHMPRLRLPLGDTDPQEVHVTLSRFVPEGEHPVPFYDRWLRKD